MPKGELIEIVDGIEIRKKPVPDAFALAVGRRGRLAKDGPVFEVHRVGQGAAYLFRVYERPEIRKFGPWEEAGDAGARARKAIADGTPDQAFTAAHHAAHLAHQCKRIEVSRGPIEPGISTATRFVEIVENKGTIALDAEASGA